MLSVTGFGSDLGTRDGSSLFSVTTGTGSGTSGCSGGAKGLGGGAPLRKAVSCRCLAGDFRGDIRSVLRGGGSLRKAGLIKGAGTRSLSVIPCGLAGSMGGLFRSGKSSWGGRLALSSNLPNPPDPPVPPLDRGGIISASLPLDLGGRLPVSSPLDRGGLPPPSSPRKRGGGRLPASPPRDPGGLVMVSLPLEPGGLIPESSLLVVEMDAATESWLMLLAPSLLSGAGWLLIRLDSILEAGDAAPFGGARVRGVCWYALIPSEEPAARRLLWEDIACSPSRGGVVSAESCRPGGGLREPRTWSISRGSKPTSSGIFPPVYFP